MKTLTQVNKSKELEKIDLQGIIIEECAEGSGGTQYKSITLRDSITNQKLVITMSNGYSSEFGIFTEKQPEYKEVIRLGGKLDGAGICKDFDKKEDAEAFAAEHSLSDVEYITVKVEKE